MLRNRTLLPPPGRTARSPLYPLGYPLHLDIDGPSAVAHEVLRAAQENWGAPEPRFQAPPVRIRVQVDHQSGLSRRYPSPRPRFTVRAGGFSLAWNPSNRGEFVSRARSGSVQVDAGFLRRRPRLRNHLLETLVFTALDSVYFTPLHAACVSKNGRAILLCGDSGAGKSCLTYACARRGWTVVADDAVHLAPAENLVAGGSRVIRLREAARALFPELDDCRTVARPNGKLAMELFPQTGGFAVTRFGAPFRVLFLSRSRRGAARLGSHPVESAVSYFLKYLWHSDTAAHVRRLHALLDGGVQRLEYEALDDAVDLLESLVAVS